MYAKATMQVLQHATKPLTVAQISDEVAKILRLGLLPKKERGELRSNVTNDLKYNRGRTTRSHGTHPEAWSLS
jgi:hypothetical protein